MGVPSAEKPSLPSRAGPGARGKAPEEGAGWPAGADRGGRGRRGAGPPLRRQPDRPRGTGGEEARHRDPPGPRRPPPPTPVALPRAPPSVGAGRAAQPAPRHSSLGPEAIPSTLAGVKASAADRPGPKGSAAPAGRGPHPCPAPPTCPLPAGSPPLPPAAALGPAPRGGRDCCAGTHFARHGAGRVTARGAARAQRGRGGGGLEGLARGLAGNGVRARRPLRMRGPGSGAAEHAGSCRRPAAPPWPPRPRAVQPGGRSPGRKARLFTCSGSLSSSCRL